jgi:hypothetical protein
MGVVVGAALLWAIAGPIAGVCFFMAAWTLGVLLFPSPSTNEGPLGTLFESYAQQRGLTVSDGAGEALPPATPLLRMGDAPEVPQILRGDLGDGTEGTLALYGFRDRHDHARSYKLTVAIIELPESTTRVSRLYGYDKGGTATAAAGPEIVPLYLKNQRVTLESDALGKRYDFLVAKDQDQNWIRRLFSPRFVVWLAEALPARFAFELEDGVLCCSVDGYAKGSEDLDRLREAAVEIAKRIREELAESSPRIVGAS